MKKKDFPVPCHLVLTETRTPSMSALESSSFRSKTQRKTSLSQGSEHTSPDSVRCPTKADPAVPWNVNCSAPNVNLDQRLSLFSQWRGTKGNDGAGLWHLMSNCPTGSQVGIAWLGTLCQFNATNSGSSMVSGTAVSTAGLTEWQVISHEMGHNFGAIVRPFRLDTDVFSDKACMATDPLA